MKTNDSKHGGKDALVRHGFWSKETLPFKDKQGNQHFGACCSNCGAILDRTKFCGECGAKMDEHALRK